MKSIINQFNIERLNWKKIKKLPYSTRLTNKIHESGHKIKITSYKTIKTNYKIQYSINPMFEYEIEKTNPQKFWGSKY